MKGDYQISGSLEVIRNFREALEYFKCHQNAFDLVLLDINLIDDTEKEGIQQALYERYFQAAKIPEAFYNEYYENSKGILLFQYLREVLKISQDRIAFLSAYVPENFTKDHKLNFSHQHLDEDDKEYEADFEDEEEEPSGNSGENSHLYRVYRKFHENYMMKCLGIEPLAFPKPNLTRRSGSVIRKDRSGSEETSASKIQHAVNLEARAAFHATFSAPNTTRYTQFRRNIIEMAKILNTVRSKTEGKDLQKKEPDLTLANFIQIYNKEYFKTKTSNGVGIERYTLGNMANYLKLPSNLPFEYEERVELLKNFLRELVACCDCLFNNFETKPQWNLSNFEKASINCLKTARNKFSHDGPGMIAPLNNQERSWQSEMLLDLVHFVVPLFFRVVYNLSFLPRTIENSEDYFQLEKALLHQEVQASEEEIHSKVAESYTLMGKV